MPIYIWKFVYIGYTVFTDTMKETTAKRREKPKASKADKQKDAGPDPQDVEMPEEDAANAVKLPKELDNLTLDGRIGS